MIKSEVIRKFQYIDACLEDAEAAIMQTPKNDDVEEATQALLAAREKIDKAWKKVIRGA